MPSPRLLGALGAVALTALSACAAGPRLQVVLPKEPLPNLFAPATWTTTCEELSTLVGAAVQRTADGHGCTARVDRPPLGPSELTLSFLAGPGRFTSISLTRRDDPPCARETPRPADCGAAASPELAIAFEVLRRAIEQRIGPPLATLAEGRDRSAEWRQEGWILTSGLFAPRGGNGWRILLVAVPNSTDEQGRPAGPSAPAPR